MGICWFCYWGWPKQIADIYTEALRRLDGCDSPLNFGPAHIVWEDENFNCAEWCLENFEEYSKDFSAEELAIVRWSLEELVKLPMEMRKEPAGYEDDDEHPELYPPAFEVVRMIPPWTEN